MDFLTKCFSLNRVSQSTKAVTNTVCALRDCDFNRRFALEEMGYGTMLWKGTVLSSGWHNWRKICQVIRLRAKRLVTSLLAI